MRLILFAVALLMGVGGLGYAPFTETGGWPFPWLLYLVVGQLGIVMLPALEDRSFGPGAPNDKQAT